MRRLNGEDGSVAVTVGVLFMGLLAILALTIDAGILHNEREELQNGADAGALAVAYSCARGACDTALAAEYGAANARPGGNTTVQSVTVNTTTQTVEVILNTPDTPMEAGQTLGYSTVLVRARGRARWGVISSGATSPFVISDCDVDRGLAAQGGSLYVTAPAGQGTIISFHNSTSSDTPKPKEDPAPCPSGPAGMDGPGGFGKILVDGTCRSETTTDTSGDWASVDPGASSPDCLVPGPMAVPVFGEVQGEGANGKYRIVSYIGFHVTGWSFPGDSFNLNASDCKEALSAEKGQATCISGWFVEYTVTDAPLCATPAACPFGVTSARMTY